LIVLNASTGDERQVIDAGTGTAGSPNGMAPPFVVDENQDRTADIVYAGDLRGNVWKFTLDGSGNWQLAPGLDTDGLLYTAKDDDGNRQPITSQLNAGLNEKQQKVVVFGTGKFLESGDGLQSDPQDLYGVIDTGEEVERSDLLEQTFEDQLEKQGGTFRLVSGDKLDDDHKGWRVSLDEDDGAQHGERSVVQPTVKGGQVVFVTTVPSSTPCDPGGESWITTVDLGYGGRPENSVFDVSGDGTIDDGDKIPHNNGQVAPTSSKSDLGNVAKPTVISGKDKNTLVLSGVGDDKQGGDCEGDCDTRGMEKTSRTGVRSWRQVR
jgi:type IV pilus assembly protein PilY1